MKALGYILATFLFPALLVVLVERSPQIARSLVTWAAHRLGDPGRAERYAAEWLAHIDEQPPGLSQLLDASRYVLGLPVMIWQVRRRRRQAAAMALGEALPRGFRLLLSEHEPAAYDWNGTDGRLYQAALREGQWLRESSTDDPYYPGLKDWARVIEYTDPATRSTRFALEIANIATTEVFDTGTRSRAEALYEQQVSTDDGYSFYDQTDVDGLKKFPPDPDFLWGYGRTDTSVGH